MLEPGLIGQVSHLVEAKDLASAFGNPGVDVLASMVVTAMFEQASGAAIKAELDPDQITVGIRLDFRHLASTPPGFTVRATAELVEVDRRRLVFEVKAEDDQELIAEGRHERFILERAKFLESVRTKAARVKS